VWSVDSCYPGSSMYFRLNNGGTRCYIGTSKGQNPKCFARVVSEAAADSVDGPLGSLKRALCVFDFFFSPRLSLNASLLQVGGV
jgi:hypothetical protein